jgi:hypothetical protein
MAQAHREGVVGAFVEWTVLELASETLEGIRKETRAGLEYALAQHKTVDILLDLNATDSS